MSADIIPFRRPIKAGEEEALFVRIGPVEGQDDWFWHVDYEVCGLTVDRFGYFATKGEALAEAQKVRDRTPYFLELWEQADEALEPWA